MMFFSNFSKHSSESITSQPFLTCQTVNHKAYALDSICIDEKCKEKNKIICILCNYESHKKHKIQPLEIFISKYRQMILNENGTNPVGLNLNIEHVMFLYHQSFTKLSKLMQDLKESFSKLLLKLNTLYSEKIEKIKLIMKEENDVSQLDSLRGENFEKVNQTVNELLNKISISEEEFKLKTLNKYPEEISKMLSSIKNLHKYIDKDLEKGYESFKKTIENTLTKFTEVIEEEKIQEKSLNSADIAHINNNIMIKNIEGKTKKLENIKIDYIKKENDLLMRNYQFNNFLEILKHDFASMVEKLDSLHTSEHELGYSNHYNNKRNFIEEFESLLRLPQKDLVYWN